MAGPAAEADADDLGPLTLIGTGHVFDIQDTVRDAIIALRPQVVFVELDVGRLRGLLERRQGKVRAPNGNWLHRRLQRFQERIAEAYGAEAGGEMMAALDGANIVGAEPHLVDRRVDITLRRVLKQLSFMERLRAMSLMLGSTVRAALPLPAAKSTVDDELARYNDDPDRALIELGRQFPTVRRVVIDERDEYMARRIRRGLRGGRTGVAVVGDGHITGLQERLADVELTTYRLPAVQAGQLPRPDDSNANASVGFDVQT